MLLKHATATLNIQRLDHRAHANFIQVPQQVRRILIHAVRARARELFFAVPARQQPNAERPRPPRREQIPNAIADHDRFMNRHTQPLRGRQKQIRIRLRVLEPDRE